MNCTLFNYDYECLINIKLLTLEIQAPPRDSVRDSLKSRSPTAWRWELGSQWVLFGVPATSFNAQADAPNTKTCQPFPSSLKCLSGNHGDIHNAVQWQPHHFAGKLHVFLVREQTVGHKVISRSYVCWFTNQLWGPLLGALLMETPIWNGISLGSPSVRFDRANPGDGG